MKRTEKKRKQKKVVLICTLATAAVIVGGMTFAWYTSKDEVTNRLSASTDYGVSIVEDFTPETDWLPGQNVKKVAGAVNTGTVDAFVRMWLTGEMKLVKENNTGVVYTQFPASLTDVTDETYTKVGLKKMVPGTATATTDGNTYYRVLNNTAQTDLKSERVSLQTGELVYAGGAYKFTANQGSNTSEQTGVAYTDGNGKIKEVDSDSFTPTSAGLFLFRRNYELDADGNIKTDTIEYSGYYFNGTDYFALKTKNNSTVPNGVPSKADNVYVDGMTGAFGTDATNGFAAKLAQVKVFTASEALLNNDNFTWTYKTPAQAADSPFNTTNPYFEVTQTGATGSTLKINVELQNIGDGSVADKWEPIMDSNSKYTFYYTNDLESGAASSALVNTVQLDKGATQNDFIAFDFDLNVNLESVQVTKDDNGKETDTPVSGDEGWAAETGAAYTAAKGTKTMDGSHDDEIAVMNWENVTNP